MTLPISEAPKPHDINPVLGIRVADWCQKVKEATTIDVYSHDYRLEGNPCMYVIPPNDILKAKDITHKFLQRVEGIKKHIKNKYSNNHLILELDFSQEPDIQAYNWRVDDSTERLVNRKNFVALVANKCINANWSGEITLDLTHHLTNLPENRRYIDFNSIVNEISKRKKKLLLVINGYGEYAIKEGFLMYQGLVQNDDNRVILLRAAENQHKFDTLGGSSWRNGGWQEVTAKYDSVTEARPLIRPEYDEKKFQEFSGYLIQAVDDIRQGKKVALKFPFQYGKTTMLRILAKLKPPNIWIGEIDSSDEKTLVSLERISRPRDIDQGIEVVIIDEAGREHAEETIQEIEKQGTKVLRIYPSDGKPPEGYELIEVK